MRVAIVIPTYQEAANLRRLVTEIREAVPAGRIVICDDNSPDGTGQLAEEIGQQVGNMLVIHREKKEGLGAAYRHGIATALEEGADIVVQMDADLSHPPSMLPELLAAIDGGADVAIGSRYVAGGATPDWPASRRWLSRTGNLYSRFQLRLPLHDATSGFRAYRADALQHLRFDTTRANGYGFLVELGFYLTGAGLSFNEIPLVFHDRTAGASKMSPRIMLETLLLVTWWGICLRIPTLSRRFRLSSVGRFLADRTARLI